MSKILRTPAKQKQAANSESDHSFTSLSPSPDVSNRMLRAPTKKVYIPSTPFGHYEVPGFSDSPTIFKTRTNRTPPEETRKVVVPTKREERMREAREYLEKHSEHISNSRNLKTEIKQGAMYAVKRIYTLLVQCNTELGEALRAKAAKAREDPVSNKETCCREAQTEAQSPNLEPVQDKEEDRRIRKIEEGQDQIARRMEEQTALLHRSLESMNNLSQIIHEYKSGFSEGSPPKPSYASVAAVKQGVRPPVYRTLHSVAITSKDTTNSADDTLREVRKALNAKEGGVEVERVRKSRDGRVIISCGSTEERDRVTRKVLKDKKDLTAENIANKKPMVMITGVLRIHTDEDLFRALKNQNKQVFEGLEKVDEGMEIAYKMRSRNPNTHRVVLKVSPPIWKRLTEVGTVKIDLQTLQVTDRSPLTQCTICLGFGHGKKLCTESQVMCSHCGGPHTMSECEEHIVGAQPKCKNCVREKKAEIGHNAFSERCPIRIKWDAIARATVAYE